MVVTDQQHWMQDISERMDSKINHKEEESKARENKSKSLLSKCPKFGKILR